MDTTELLLAIAATFALAGCTTEEGSHMRSQAGASSSGAQQAAGPENESMCARYRRAHEACRSGANASAEECERHRAMMAEHCAQMHD